MRYRPFLLFMVLLPLVAGCFRSPSARFYSLIAEPHVDERPRLLSDGVRLEVSSIIFPRYLDDPRMVVRTGANEIRRDEYERWIESPRTNFRDALLKGLSESSASRKYSEPRCLSQTQTAGTGSRGCLDSSLTSPLALWPMLFPRATCESIQSFYFQTPP